MGVVIQREKQLLLVGSWGWISGQSLHIAPKSNGMAEAFVKTFKRDYAWFGDLKDAQTVMGQLGKWVEDYNERAPHKALKRLSPREFIKGQKLVS